jgi:hypothetical protein
MKHNIIYWIMFGVIFVASMGIFYSYWKVTNENPITALYNVIVKTTNPDNSKQNINNDEFIQSAIFVAKNSEIPTAVVEGDLANYQFSKSQQTGENELYVKLLVEGKIFPARVDYFSVSGKGPGYDFIVKDLDQSQNDKMVIILEESKVKTASIMDNYIILTSINNLKQKELCVNFYGPSLGGEWCKFDPTKKSYSGDELINLVEKYLEENRQNTDNMAFSQYLTLGGNVLITLQVNYKTGNPNK